jgi:RHH-type rel operon transcriptional repressor/antitoxin RelB
MILFIMKTSVLTIRIDEDIKKRLNKLAEATDRTKSFIASEAIRSFLDLNEWHIQAIYDGISDADQGRMVEHEHVVSWIESWDSDNELERPQCD